MAADAGALYLALWWGIKNDSKNQAADRSFESALGALIVFLAIAAAVVVYYRTKGQKAVVKGILWGIAPIIGLVLSLLYVLIIS
ncbi:hypothetical protein F0P96_19010 [Hymenobacter busanensis]|uniref:Uncharacterized protein n=1 Tax=Hymenobacter busanensis TaxID=2607656 RepID=A0A7L4ZVQ9_9BACT|nr:hypothetical protein [Hymenobacter busanensis]KAA9325858.1 hypothetical protein F0P96_19010 [Hymenobacter busanensis]QHJ06302.1 hypothetical protein GUY19_02915 [Hymenobacter busanensis]